MHYIRKSLIYSTRKAFQESALPQVMSQPAKVPFKRFDGHIHIIIHTYIYIILDTYNDHITPACASVCRVTIEQSLQPVSPHAAQCPVHLSNDLATCTHIIFIRHDGVVYINPYKGHIIVHIRLSRELLGYLQYNLMDF